MFIWDFVTNQLKSKASFYEPWHNFIPFILRRGGRSVIMGFEGNIVTIRKGPTNENKASLANLSIPKLGRMLFTMESDFFVHQRMC